MPALRKGQLVDAEDRTRGTLVFDYNPTEIKYNRTSTYSKNQAAKADFPNASKSAFPAYQWIRNEAEEISFDLILYSLGGQSHNGNPYAQERGQQLQQSKRTVTEQLRQLDRFMRRDPTLGQPRPLRLIFGLGRSDRVILLSKTVTNTLFTPDLEPQQAKVNVVFGCLNSWDGK